MGHSVIGAVAPDGSHMTTEQIERELLKLPASDRARLAQALIASLDEDAEVEKEWVAEVRRRDEELESGAADSILLEVAVMHLRRRPGYWKNRE